MGGVFVIVLFIPLQNYKKEWKENTKIIVFLKSF